MRQKLARLAIYLLASLGVIVASLFLYLDRGLGQNISPTQFDCVRAYQGDFLKEPITFKTLWGVGLSYADHINETASQFDPAQPPPVFRKDLASLAYEGASINLPDHRELLAALKKLEPDVEQLLQQEQLEPLPLLDYEVELAFVLLEDITESDWQNAEFVPRLGFFIANDISARSIAILGEGQSRRYEYWGRSKSFAGFTPVSRGIWEPYKAAHRTLPCVQLSTLVDGERRQNTNTAQLIYTPLQMLRFIKEQGENVRFKRGDVVLTGTPGGVALEVPRWKARLAQWLGYDRFQKLRITQNQAASTPFLQPGNRVEVSGEWLGQVSVIIGP